MIYCWLCSFDNFSISTYKYYIFPTTSFSPLIWVPCSNKVLWFPDTYPWKQKTSIRYVMPLLTHYPDSQYYQEVLTLKQQTSIRYVVPLLTHYPDSQYCQEVLILKQQTSIRYIVPLLTHYPDSYSTNVYSYSLIVGA